MWGQTQYLKREARKYIHYNDDDQKLRRFMQTNCNNKVYINIMQTISSIHP